MGAVDCKIEGAPKENLNPNIYSAILESKLKASASGGGKEDDMKKISCSIVAFFLLFSLLNGCSGSKAAEKAPPEISPLTPQQMLADYDAMWKNIEEDYPLMGVAARTTHKDFAKIKAQYRAGISNVKSNDGFYTLLDNCVKEFQETGHLSLVLKEEYPSFLSVYQKYQDTKKGAYLYHVLDNPISKAFYRYVPTDIYAQAEKAASENGGSRNITTKIIEKEQIAYLKVKTLGSQFVSVDAPAIAGFFAEIKDYPNCIIDIRGNGGGDSRYWIENIVMPNIDRDMNYTSYELIKGERAKEYLSNVQTLTPISKFQKLPKTNADDLAQMQYFTENTNTVNSKTGKKVYSGKFYLLTDGGVYSSSEAFAYFCKQTGFADIVGDPTDGDGVGTDPLIFALPNSGICFRFSASLGLNSDGASNEEFGTQPDTPCTQGKDALSTCLDLIASKR